MKLVAEGVFYVLWAVSGSDYPQLPAKEQNPLVFVGFLLRVVVRGLCHYPHNYPHVGRTW
jgi:hypothetical protein